MHSRRHRHCGPWTIGCGANLIYPLLGSSLHGWRFVAADITDAAIAGGRQNLARKPSPCTSHRGDFPSCCIFLENAQRSLRFMWKAMVPCSSKVHVSSIPNVEFVALLRRCGMCVRRTVTSTHQTEQRPQLMQRLQQPAL